MGADSIIYCLEQVTDYDQFERLCHDLMALEGYPNIEPLGGSKDKGRDAIHVSRDTQGTVTIFAYSVREDWRRKLGQDAENVRKNKHDCQQLVFLTTSDYTSSERDSAIADISQEYGWNVELYGLERLRVLLAATHPEVVAKHPQIFTRPFFPQAGGLSTAECRDYVVIDHVDTDSALAEWIARRLALEGYHSWCKGLAPVAGASISDTVEALISSRAYRFVSVLSAESLADPDLSARRTLAITTDEEMLLPVIANPIDRSKLESKAQKVESINFTESWAKGLSSLLEVLENSDCSRSKSDPTITSRSFVQKGLVTAESEVLVSNRFKVLDIPSVIRRFTSTKPMKSDARKAASQQWSFRMVDDRQFLSFWSPPASVVTEFQMKEAGGGVWESVRDINGIFAQNLVSELIRKSLQLYCIEKGLEFCKDRNLFYFPEGLVPSSRLYFTKHDGSRTFVGATGKRTYWRPGTSEPYKYQLSPAFSVDKYDESHYCLLVRMRVRLTDEQDKVLSKQKGLSRRKHLCRNWWNDDWLHRVMAVMQFLSSDDERIVIREDNACLEFASTADYWEVGTRLDESVLNNVDEAREDALTYADDDFVDEGKNGD